MIVANIRPVLTARRYTHTGCMNPPAPDFRRAAVSLFAVQNMNDLRLAVRQLAKSPGFTAIAVLTLALGIGLVTVQFSFVYGALIKGLPFEAGERIHAIDCRNATRPVLTTLAHFVLLKERQHAFEYLGAYRGNGINVSGEGLIARRYPGVECTADLLTMTGIVPQLGRMLRPDDDLPGAARVVVLRSDVWKNDFGGASDAIGRTVRIDGKPATIIGVLPAGFGFPLQAQVWTNLTVPSVAATSWTTYIDVVGRLRPDTTLPEARAQLAVIAASIAADGPKRENLGTQFALMPLAHRQVQGLDTVLWSLLAMVGAVLVLACINVANLLYVHSVRQRHEFAVRLALGASRARLVRQTLALSLLLAGLGAAVGAWFAAWTVPVINHFFTDPQKPYWVALDLDARVLGATIALTLVVGVLAGLLPALRSARFDPLANLRDGGNGATGASAGRASQALTLGQIVLSAAVLVVATVLSRGIYQIDADCYPGNRSRVLVASTVFRPANDEPTRTAGRAEFLDAVASLPGIETVALTTRDPDRRGFPTPVEIEHQPVSRDRREQVASEWISSGYFRTFGLVARRGRLFTAADRAGSEPVVIVNESFARRYWPNQDPIGQRCRFEDSENTPRWHTVIGVVDDLSMGGVTNARNEPGVYLPLYETSASRVNVLLTGGTDPHVYIQPLQQLLHRLAPDQPFQSILTLDALVDRRLQLPRVISTIAAVFGMTAALLAAVGIFGTTAFLVERRRREFGIRIALGAPLHRILTLVLRRGAVQLMLGLPLGLVLGWVLTLPLQHLPVLRAIAHVDPSDLAIGAVALSAGVLAACWLPARRATAIDPAEALRAE
jgi:putative ABC transport system permease protein